MWPPPSQQLSQNKKNLMIWFFCHGDLKNIVSILITEHKENTVLQTLEENINILLTELKGQDSNKLTLDNFKEVS